MTLAVPDLFSLTVAWAGRLEADNGIDDKLAAQLGVIAPEGLVPVSWRQLKRAWKVMHPVPCTRCSTPSAFVGLEDPNPEWLSATVVWRCVSIDCGHIHTSVTDKKLIRAALRDVGIRPLWALPSKLP